MRNIFFDSYGSLREGWFILSLIGCLLLAMLLIFVLLSGFLAILEYNQCAHFESIDQINIYDWSYWSGCLVRTQNGFYIDVDSLGSYELIHESPR